MKISVIGAGNVGSLTALRIAEEFACEVVLMDVAQGLAVGKSLDLNDARNLRRINYNVTAAQDASALSKSDIIVITAGLTRKPGMQREELLAKNAAIVKELCQSIKDVSPEAIVIVVTNPLDMMTYLALKTLKFSPAKVFGMGITLDAARFANLIAEELKVPCTEVDALVISSHGEGMLPLPSFTKVSGKPLSNFIDEEKIKELIQMTIGRGQQIVSNLGSGSAYFAPSAAISGLVRAIVKDEKRIIGVSAYLNGEYGVSDVCIGVPVRLGRQGIEQIVELPLSNAEKNCFLASVTSLKTQLNKLLS